MWKNNVVAMTAVALSGSLFPNPVTAQDVRYAVVHITNDTEMQMPFYFRWVWHEGTNRERVQVDWRLTTIPVGATYTVHHDYDGVGTQSPDLIVVFDADSNRGAHWEKVKLTPGSSSDYKNRRLGFRYAWEYDGVRREYASFRPKNGGTVTILDRRSAPPPDATEVPFGPVAASKIVRVPTRQERAAVRPDVAAGSAITRAPNALQIRSVASNDVTFYTAVVTFVLNQPADAVVKIVAAGSEQYRAYRAIQRGADGNGFSYRTEIRGLKSDTTYHFVVSARDSRGVVHEERGRFRTQVRIDGGP